MNITTNQLFRPLSEGEVYCNGRLLLTPAGEVLECVWASRPIFKCVAAEPLEKKKRGRYFHEEDGLTEGRIRAARRAKKELFQLARCNEFDCFATFTLSPDKVNRYDDKQVIGKVNNWLDNQVRRKGLRYVLVPERHKDGALHFHGLMNSDALDLKDSGHRDNSNRKIWNVASWRYGFTTAVKLDGSYDAVCKYIAKYITKQLDDPDTKDTGRYFYRGGALQHPAVKYIDWRDPPEGIEVKMEEAKLTLRYVDVTQVTP